MRSNPHAGPTALPLPLRLTLLVPGVDADPPARRAQRARGRAGAHRPRGRAQGAQREGTGGGAAPTGVRGTGPRAPGARLWRSAGAAAGAPVQLAPAAARRVAARAPGGPP